MYGLLGPQNWSELGFKRALEVVLGPLEGLGGPKRAPRGLWRGFWGPLGPSRRPKKVLKRGP